MRGQAFIIFNDVNSASSALRSMQGFPFYDKPMRIAYAKEQSDVIAKRYGTYLERPKKDREAERAAMKDRKKQQAVDATGATIPPPAAMTATGTELPNKILFLTNLPEGTEQSMLQMLFQPFSGFKEVRLVPGRSDIAFVEFENEQLSTMAKDALQGFKMGPNNPIKITYAKK
jgi:U2 small nuclear ribonucleoprotein B''